MKTEIEIRTGEELRICEEVEEAIQRARLGVYASGGRLVVAIEGDTLDTNRREAKSTRLLTITKHRMKVIMVQACRFGYVEYEGNKRHFRLLPVSSSIADMILARNGYWPFEEVSGLMCCQSIDTDGNVINKEGVHRESGLLFRNLPKLPPIPEHPTRADALVALDVFKDLLKEFPFVDPDGKKDQSLSVAISMLVSPLASAAFRKAPITLVRAPVAGTGKSFLCRIAAALMIGRSPAIVPYTADETEFEKRLTGIILQGSPLVVFDNVNGVLSSLLLCQALTEDEIDVRPLGTSVISRTKVRAAWIANGNNISATSDLLRRCLLSILDRNEERPELHAFTRNPLAEVMADRGKFIAAALTILRAYAEAGRPDRKPKLASYEEWSDVVRSALCWLGLPDPVGSMEEIRGEDEGQQKIQAVIDAWPVLNMPYTVKELVECTKGTVDQWGNTDIPANVPLREAFEDIAVTRTGDLNTKSIGRFLLRNMDRVFPHPGKIAVKLRKVDAGINKAKWQLDEVKG